MFYSDKRPGHSDTRIYLADCPGPKHILINVPRRPTSQVAPSLNRSAAGNVILSPIRANVAHHLLLATTGDAGLALTRAVNLTKGNEVCHQQLVKEKGMGSIEEDTAEMIEISRRSTEAAEKGLAVTHALQAAQVNATLALQMATLMNYGDVSRIYGKQAEFWLKEAGYWKE